MRFILIFITIILHSIIAGVNIVSLGTHWRREKGSRGSTYTPLALKKIEWYCKYFVLQIIFILSLYYLYYHRFNTI